MGKRDNHQGKGIPINTIERTYYEFLGTYKLGREKKTEMKNRD